MKSRDVFTSPQTHPPYIYHIVCRFTHILNQIQLMSHMRMTIVSTNLI